MFVFDKTTKYGDYIFFFLYLGIEQALLAKVSLKDIFYLYSVLFPYFKSKWLPSGYTDDTDHWEWKGERILSLSQHDRMFLIYLTAAGFEPSLCH